MLCSVDSRNILESSKPTEIKREASYRCGRCGPSIPVPSATLHKNVSSLKKLISVQRCRGLWGSFGLASYLTVNAIYWIMNLLCSQDCVEWSQPVFSLKKDLRWTQEDLWEYRKTHGFVLYGGNPGEAGEAERHRVCTRNLLWRANKIRVKSPPADTLFMYCSFWVFHLSGQS